MKVWNVKESEKMDATGGRLSGNFSCNGIHSITGGVLLFTGVSMRLPYFKFMVQDWLAGNIQACSMETQGFFTNLIARIWKAKGNFSIAQADLAALLHTTEDVVKRCLEDLLKWHIVTIAEDGSFHVCFIDEQLEELSQEHEAKVVAGRLGAKIKAQKKSSTAKAELKHSSESELETHTDTDKKNTLSDKPDIMRIEFEECWKIYPDKSGKENAWKAYKKARHEGTTQGDVLAGLNRYIAYVKHRQTTDFKDLKYKNGSTWFNQRCWQDEYTIIAKERKIYK